MSAFFLPKLLIEMPIPPDFSLSFMFWLQLHLYPVDSKKSLTTDIYYLQYRMHPEICLFPSMHFYESKLLNGEMSSKSAPFHETEGLGPYVFNDVVDGRELRGKNSGAMSLYNEHEADAAVEVLKFLKNRYILVFSRVQNGIKERKRKETSICSS